jgi:hypothetical protein
MHFHLPKPLHGWREFVGEVAIIVLGVLIALGAEQLVEIEHWRHAVRDTDQRMRHDLGYDLAIAYERPAIDPCLRPRLAQLRDELLTGGPNWPGSRARFANDLYKSGFPSVYRTPDRPWVEASWLTALNSDVLSHFEPARVQQLASLFDEVTALEQTQSEEVDTATTLGDLAFAGPITPAERRANLKVVAKLDALDARMLFEAHVLLNDSRLAGLAPDPTAVRQLLDQQRSYRGSCVAQPQLKAG